MRDRWKKMQKNERDLDAVLRGVCAPDDNWTYYWHALNIEKLWYAEPPLLWPAHNVLQPAALIAKEKSA